MRQDCDEWDNLEPLPPITYPGGCSSWYDGCNYHNLDRAGGVLSITLNVCPDLQNALASGFDWQFCDAWHDSHVDGFEAGADLMLESGGKLLTVVQSEGGKWHLEALVADWSSDHGAQTFRYDGATRTLVSTMLPHMSITVSKCGGGLVLATTHGGADQHFRYDHTSQHVYVSGGGVLDAHGASLVADANGAASQRWKLDYLRTPVCVVPVHCGENERLEAGNCVPDYNYYVKFSGTVSVSATYTGLSTTAKTSSSVTF